MTNFKKVLILVTVLIVSLIVVFFSSDWNRAAFGSKGYIEQGEKFGLTIGDSKQEVIEYLVAKGLLDVTKIEIRLTGHNPQRCHGHIYGDEYIVQVWSDSSWRRGIICAAFIDGKLVHLSWLYSMLQP
jgi:hypothetical protein